MHNKRKTVLQTFLEICQRQKQEKFEEKVENYYFSAGKRNFHGTFNARFKQNLVQNNKRKMVKDKVNFCQLGKDVSNLCFLKIPKISLT